jgi:hypothetical protein
MSGFEPHRGTTLAPALLHQNIAALSQITIPQHLSATPFIFQFSF